LPFQGLIKWYLSKIILGEILKLYIITEKQLEAKRRNDEIRDIRLRIKKGKPTTFSERLKINMLDKAKKRSLKILNVQIVQKRLSSKKTTIVYVKKDRPGTTIIKVSK
jgi:hypothetical protein